MPRIPKPRIGATAGWMGDLSRRRVTRTKKANDKILKAGAARLFRRADANGDGTLSKGEYEAILGFESLRKGNSSSISQEQFLAVLSRRRTGRPVPVLTQCEPISSKQYYRMALKSGLPFIAFGFVDNLIMITAGDQIEASVGVAFSLSTMAAAGLGNMLSDVVGIGVSDRIESLIVKLGLPSASLSVAQLTSPKAQRVRVFAQIVGISIGCLLGMLPLLFMDEDKRKLESSFLEADISKAGSLNCDEVSFAFHRAGLRIDAEEVKWLMGRCGKDHKALTFDEFVELVQHWKEFNSEYEASKHPQATTGGELGSCNLVKEIISSK